MLEIDDRILLAAKNLPLLARQLVAGYMQGMHRSPFRGSSQEFAAYRQYMPGDSIRNVDWKVWARTDDLFIREYVGETNYRGYLFLDASKSMDYGDGPTHKFNYAKILCATLAMMMKNQNDAAGLILLGHPENDAAKSYIAPSTRTDHLDHLLVELQEMEARGECDNLGDALDKVEECHSRSISILVSDGFFSIEQGQQFLDQLRLRNHDTIFFHLLSPQEMQPNFDDDMIMIDSETGQELTVDGIAMREPYEKKLNEFLDQMQQLCVQTETDYCRIVTDEPLEEALRRYLEIRESR